MDRTVKIARKGQLYVDVSMDFTFLLNVDLAPYSNFAKSVY